jgi:lipoprotein
MVKVRSFILQVSMLCLLLGGISSSCRQAAKKVAREVIEESAEELVEKSGKKALKEIGEEAGAKLLERDVKKAIQQIASENKFFADIWDQAPSTLRKSVVKSVEDNPRFLNLLKSESRVLDEYVAKGSKNALNSSDLFSFFAESASRSKRMYGYSPLDAIDMVDEGKAIKFISRSSDRRALGELKDGILSLRLLDNGEDIFRQPLLRDHLIPNTSYKIRTASGELKYTIRTDALGRVSSMEGKAIDPHKLELNVLKFRDGVDLDLGGAVKPSSAVDVKVRFSYAGAGDVPYSAKLDLKGGNSYRYSDIALNRSVNKAKSIGEHLLKNQGLLGEQAEKVIKECENNSGLKELVLKDPSNAKRFLNTKNPVDKSLLARTANGSYVPNSSYAGNTYYFHPALNSKLAVRLRAQRGHVSLDGVSKLSVEDCIHLHEKFPNGIPFSKSGHPDFSPVAYMRNGKPVEIDLSNFRIGNVDRGADINMANKLFKKTHGFDVPKGYTWHHIEGTRKVILVDTRVHQLVRHAGGISSHKLVS